MNVTKLPLRDTFLISLSARFPAPRHVVSQVSILQVLHFDPITVDDLDVAEDECDSSTQEPGSYTHLTPPTHRSVLIFDTVDSLTTKEGEVGDYGIPANA